MPLVFDEEKQEYVYEAAEESSAPATDPNDPSVAFQSYSQRLNQQVAGQQEQEVEAIQNKITKQVNTNKVEDKPLFGDLGATTRDIARIFGNAPAALATDYGDLVFGLADVGYQGLQAAQGKGFDGNEIFNDADNPFTKQRLEHLGADSSETKIGQVVNQVVRFGVSILALPKIAIRGAFLPLKLLGKASKLGKVAKVSGKAAKFGDDFADAAKLARPFKGVAEATDTIADIQKISKSTAKGKTNFLVDAAQQDEWLFMTYKDIVNSPMKELGGLHRNIGRAARNLTRGKATVKTVGQALAWDAFVSFNIAGEGTSFDENFTDMLKEMGAPFYIPQLATNVGDTPTEIKVKSMIDGTILGAGMSAFFDLWRVSKYASAFKEAAPEEKARLVKLFNGEAQGLGKSISKLDDIQVDAADALAQTRFGPQQAPLVAPELDEYANATASARAQNQYNLETQANANNISPGSIEFNRPLEPTVTPNGFKRAFAQALDFDLARRLKAAETTGQMLDVSSFRAIQDKALSTLPRTRVDALNYLDNSPLSFDSVGTMNAADTLRNDYFLATGLTEGWIKVDPNLNFVSNRSVAFSADQGDRVAKQASAADQAADLERYNQKMNPQGQADPATAEVQAALDPENRPLDPDALVSNPNLIDTTPQPRTELGDQAIVEAKRQEDLAKVEQAGAANTEDAEIVAQAAAEYRRDVGDAQMIEEMLGVNASGLGEFTIEKVGNRKYQVLNSLGESIDGKTYPTLVSARKGKDIADKALFKQVSVKARAMADQRTDKIIPMSFGSVDFASNVRGPISFTKRQIQELTQYGFDASGTNFNLSQAEMLGMRQAINSLIENASGSQKGVLKQMKSKLDVAIKQLEPDVLMAKETDRTLELSRKLLDNGEICYG